MMLQLEAEMEYFKHKRKRYLSTWRVAIKRVLSHFNWDSRYGVQPDFQIHRIESRDSWLSYETNKIGMLQLQLFFNDFLTKVESLNESTVYDRFFLHDPVIKLLMEEPCCTWTGCDTALLDGWKRHPSRADGSTSADFNQLESQHADESIHLAHFDGRVVLPS